MAAAPESFGCDEPAPRRFGTVRRRQATPTFERRQRMLARGARRIRRRGPARPNRAHHTATWAHVTFVDCRFRFEASCARLAEAGARSSKWVEGRTTQPFVCPVTERDVVAFPVQNHGWRKRPARKSRSRRSQARESARSRSYPDRPRAGSPGVDHFVSGLEPKRGLRMGQACQRSPSSRALLERSELVAPEPRQIEPFHATRDLMGAKAARVKNRGAFPHADARTYRLEEGSDEATLMPPHTGGVVGSPG